MKSVLETLGQAVNHQRNAYENTLQSLAEKLESGGYLAAMFMRPDADEYLSINLRDQTYQELLNGPEANRINYIKGEIDFWVMDGSWDDKVDTYNRIADGRLQELDRADFADLAQEYTSMRAVLDLDSAVRQSPQVRSAGLSQHGVVAPSAPDTNPTADTIKPPSWMGNANDGVGTKP